MSIIKAEDFAKIQQNELTLTALKDKEHVEKNYRQAHFRIRERLVEADRIVAFTPQEEIQMLREKIALAKEYFGAAEKEVQQLKTDLAGDKGVQRLQAELENKNKLLAEQADQIEHLQVLLQEKTALLVSQSNELTRIETENEHLHREISIAKRTIEKFTARETELLKQVEFIQDTNNLATKEIAALKTNVTALTDRVAAQEETIRKLENEKKGLIESREKTMQEMNRVIESFSAEQEKNIQLEYKFKRAEQEYREIQTELSEAKTIISSVEALVANRKPLSSINAG
jgi:DNA repair exonuclease SbcCD ATPase subunit